MRRCEFIFPGKWDFDRKFTEHLPAFGRTAGGYRAQDTALLCALFVLSGYYAYCLLLHCVQERFLTFSVYSAHREC